MTCNCEKEERQQTSEEIHTWGPIRDDEMMLLAGIHPLNCQNGELQPGAFDADKLKKQNPSENVSVCRRDYSSAAEIQTKIIDPQLRRDAARRLEDVFLASARKIRSIEVGDTGIKAFCVIDDGRVDFPSHAAVSYSDKVKTTPEFWSKVSKKNRRSLKIETIENLTHLFRETRCALPQAFATVNAASPGQST